MNKEKAMQLHFAAKPRGIGKTPQIQFVFLPLTHQFNNQYNPTSDHSRFHKRLGWWNKFYLVIYGFGQINCLFQNE